LVAFAGAIVELSCCVPPINIEAVVGDTLTPFTSIGLTVITLVAVLEPSAVVTVIVAVPTDKPVTSPVALTVATAVLLLLQVTFWFVALAGAIVAVNCCVPPIKIEAVVGDTLTPVTSIGFTIMTDVAVKLPSAVVTVIVAVPTETPVTRPVALTVATAVLLLLQVTLWLVAFAGAIVAANSWVPPINIEAVVGLTITPVTSIGLTVMTEVAVLAPS
jgi:hypothetical protein